MPPAASLSSGWICPLSLEGGVGLAKQHSAFAGLGDKSDAAQHLYSVVGLVISPGSDSSLEGVSIQGSADSAAVKWARSKNSHKIIRLNVSFSSLVSKDLKDVESCIGLKPTEQRGRVKYLQPQGNRNKM